MIVLTHGASVDKSDPAERAAARLETVRRRDRNRRVALALTFGALAAAAPLTAEPITGDPGAIIGAVVLGLLLLALAAVVWPYRWYPREEEHRALDAIWRELRSDAAESVPWERFAAWATPREGVVELALLRCAPARERVAATPSPYSLEVVRRLETEDVAEAAEAMEKLRVHAAEQELEARDRHEHERAEAARLAHERTMREIDAASETEIEANEAQMKYELAQQERAERQAQAEAVARALRKP